MKHIIYIILFVLITNNLTAQKKWYSITKNDIAIMSLEIGAGYAQGWREEVLYHPNALFRRFPNLNRNFWDNRISWQRNTILDANHVLKATTTTMRLTAICIKIGGWKDLKKQDRWKKILFDIVKYYASYQLGFFLSYNLTHNNQLKWK
jgi:hypothetical protein